MDVKWDEARKMFCVIDDEHPEGDERNVRYSAATEDLADVWLAGYAAGAGDYGA